MQDGSRTGATAGGSGPALSHDSLEVRTLAEAALTRGGSTTAKLIETLPLPFPVGLLVVVLTK